ncbi:triosephosphate isomerase [Holotrichia oblita]|nr:triosephosphate isomerase [Holotrichia oblita]
MQTKSRAELIRYTDNPEATIAAAARLCYSADEAFDIVEKAEEKDNAKYIKMLLSLKHLSPFEHASFTFCIEGVSRAFLAQITRHRIASFSVRSQRYVSEGGFNYIVPPAIESLGAEAVDRYKNQMQTMQSWYEEWQTLLGGNTESANEDARFVLPNACATQMIVSMNARELMHFFSLRCCTRAQWEIRNVAWQMLQEVLKVAPNIFEASGPSCVYGACAEGERQIMRKPIIAGNWKMNNTKKEAEALVNQFKPLVKDAKCDVVVCVPFTNIETVAAACKGSNIKVGAQNVSWADKGAFTGEISADMLKDVGAEYVVIGHSERRQMFGETDKTVNMRTQNALKSGLKPIVCIGETLDEREGSITEKVVTTQIKGAFEGVDAKLLDNVVVAYEPVWAIGTGKTATAEQAQETILYIRSVFKGLYGENVANALRIQYGGSMNASNASELMKKPDIDGGLIGGASLKAEDFSKVVNF